MALPAPRSGERVPRTALETDLKEEPLLLRYLLLGNISDWQFESVRPQASQRPLRTFRGRRAEMGRNGSAKGRERRQLRNGINAENC